MKLLISCLLFTFALAVPIAANAELSMLRVMCEDDDAGAKVTVNGKFKGECPIDFQVAPGTLKLRVVKQIDNEYEWMFEQEISMGEGVVKKVEAALVRTLTAAGKKREKAPLNEIVIAANKGDAFAQYQLAKHYYSGQGVVKDEVEAAKWTRKAAEQGLAEAQSFLGLQYRIAALENSNQDVNAINLKEAKKWFRKAADQGEAIAQAEVGEMYEKDKNCEEALRWFRKAARQGDVGGIGGIARHYFGRCDMKFLDREEANKWRSKLQSYIRK